VVARAVVSLDGAAGLARTPSSHRSACGADRRLDQRSFTMRRIVWLLAVVGAMVGLVFSQTGNAVMIPPHEEQPCQEDRRPPPTFWTGGTYVGQPNGGLSNDADQCNGEIKQWGVNKPYADIDQKNKNESPQYTMYGDNYQYNKQKNEADIDQSQEQEAFQGNFAFQEIATNEQPPWTGNGEASPLVNGGGGAPLSNDADQTNESIDQHAWNQPYLDLEQKNKNVSPQMTVWGDNYQYNKQSNEADVDQSQEQEAAQVNFAAQSIERNVAPPVDPENDADQTNESIDQGAYNHPYTDLEQKNINASPQVTVWGDNYQSNHQSNDADVDQSQEQEAAQANFAGQSIQEG
jgi:hypothetical protein